MASNIQESLDDLQNQQPGWNAKAIFAKLIQKDQLVGDLYSINYEEGKVLVHDFYRQKVGGIPSLSFLIATRINPENDIDYKAEDASIILLRVMDAAQIPQDKDAEKVRIETAQRISGEADKNWDGEESMDLKTRHVFSYAGVSCRIIGTFFLEEDETKPHLGLKLKFGSDISNYYSNKGFKIFKPNATALEEIVNYIDPESLDDYKKEFQNSSKVKLGKVRYASTNRKHQGIDGVPVYIYPADLVAQKTALFGMTRTGKSNTTKIILKSVYELRYPEKPYEEKTQTGDKPIRIGQIVFDPNGEYANENTQDQGTSLNPTAIKNIWQNRNANKADEVVTYGIVSHPNDPDRKMMLLNFFLEDNLQIGKEIIDNSFNEKESKFIENFKQIVFIKPPEAERSPLTRYRRRVLAYLSLLAKAGFEAPAFSATTPGWRGGTNNASSYFNYTTTGLFSTELLNGRVNPPQGTAFQGMSNYLADPDAAVRFRSAATTFQNPRPTLISLSDAFNILNDFMKTDDYRAFERWYVEERPNASGDNWADEDLKKILLMLSQPNGARQIGQMRPYHTHTTTSDYANDIYDDLSKGKLVIIDQSSGEPEINKSSADRIMTYIFKRNQSDFREGKRPCDILIYVEEAHNLLPSGKENDTKDIWVRTAKEGAKYRLGLVYATQEVSSIQKNILKNTANWFISHLNNSDETKELCKYYDFIDFEPSIRRAQDKGFLRIKTLSNMFVIPVQIDKFELNINGNG
jgi:hypothetical protein